jgi:hypothetical protein
MFQNDACAVCWNSHDRHSVESASSGLTKRHYGGRWLRWHVRMVAMGIDGSRRSCGTMGGGSIISG